MIYAFAAELKNLLDARGWSVPVTYGPEAFTRQPNSTLIVVMRDGATDTFGPNRVAGKANGLRAARRGRYIATRNVGGQCIIFAQNTKANATRWDHEELSDDLSDAVFCAAEYWTNGLVDGQPRNAPITFGTCRFVDKKELPGQFDKFTGLVYEMPFSLQRGVYDSDKRGEGYPVSDPIAAVNTDVTGNGDPVTTLLVPPIP